MFHQTHFKLWSQYNADLWTEVLLCNGFELPEINTDAVSLIAKSEVINWSDFNELTSDMEPIYSGRLRRRLQNSGLVLNTGIKGGFNTVPSDTLKELVSIIETFARDNVSDVVRACDRLSEAVTPFDASFTIERGNRQPDLTVTEPSKGLSVTECLFYGALLVLWFVLVCTGLSEVLEMCAVIPAARIFGLLNKDSVKPLLTVSEEDIKQARATRVECAKVLYNHTRTSPNGPAREWLAMGAATIAATATMRRFTPSVAWQILRTYNALNGHEPVNELNHRVTVIQAVCDRNVMLGESVKVLSHPEGDWLSATMLTSIKGLGPAKSSFSVQLLDPNSTVVCIDSRNLDTFKVSKDLKRALRDMAFYRQFCVSLNIAYDTAKFGKVRHNSDFSDCVWALWVNGLATQHGLTVAQVNEYHIKWCEHSSAIARLLPSKDSQNILKVLRKEHWVK